MLSRNFKTQRPDETYDFVIVGSGYGGSITAARIATAGLNPKPKICILERGKEWEPGKFPDKLGGLIGEVRSNSNRLGLFDLVNYDPISVVKGNGLGGTSLINANVAIVPDEDVFEMDGWPSAITRDELLPYFEQARQVLAAKPHPRFNELLKVRALKRRADELGTGLTQLDIAVNFDIDGVNEHGVTQKPCTDCGDCVSGCNVAAKNTLYMNYLPMANNANASGNATVHIYTQTKVEWVKKLAGGGWQVHGVFVEKVLDLPGAFLDFFRETPFDIKAKNVVLSAGSVNSTEILLRSANKQGLSISPMAGQRFGGNGDFFGLSYNGDTPCGVLGFGAGVPNPNPDGGPGPTITAAIRYNADAPVGQRFAIEDTSIPKGFVEAAQQAFAFAIADDTDDGDEDEEDDRIERDQFGANRYAPNGALNHTMLYLCVGFDNAQGRFVFETPFLERDGRVKVVWPNAGEQPIFEELNAEIRRHAEALGGSFIENPLFGLLDLKRLITVHPLGGCPMGDDHTNGAVDQFGRVFAADGSIHEGLFVIDGAAMPTALGVNPFLTISAFAERAAAYKILEMGGTPYPARAAAAGGGGR